MNDDDYVYAFHPRKRDHPHFVAEDGDELASKLGEFLPGEQCDGCGNHSYRLDVQRGESGHLHYYAVCAVDPDDSDEFRHDSPCGSLYPVHRYRSSEVVF